MFAAFRIVHRRFLNRLDFLFGDETARSRVTSVLPRSLHAPRINKRDMERPTNSRLRMEEPSPNERSRTTFWRQSPGVCGSYVIVATLLCQLTNVSVASPP